MPRKAFKLKSKPQETRKAVGFFQTDSHNVGLIYEGDERSMSNMTRGEALSSGLAEVTLKDESARPSEGSEIEVRRRKSSHPSRNGNVSMALADKHEDLKDPEPVKQSEPTLKTVGDLDYVQPKPREIASHQTEREQVFDLVVWTDGRATIRLRNGSTWCKTYADIDAVPAEIVELSVRWNLA